MKLLAPSVSATLPDEFFAAGGGWHPEFEGLVTEEGRDVAVMDVVDLLDRARTDHADAPAQSDRWLGPRLHAALRLTRREASRREMWLHLAIVDGPDYVRWRWPNGRERFFGGAVTNGLSRLWWSTELFRQGVDYGPADRALQLQEVPNTVLKLVAVRNQPFCAALLEFIEHRRTDGSRLIGRQINRLATATNSQLFVTALDAVAPSGPRSGQALRKWISHPEPIDDLLSKFPTGPPDLVDPLFDEKVQAALQLLHRVADSAGIATADDPAAGSRRPGDVVVDEQEEHEEDL